jgi:hypothetical protein
MRILFLLLVFSSGAAVSADSSSVPELGVVFGSVPEHVQIPAPIEVPEGFSIQIPLGLGSLGVNRYDDNALASRPISNLDYQKQRRQEQESKGLHVSSAVVTQIDGHDAFLILGTQTPIPGAPVAIYHCFASVISENQLIDFHLSALGKPNRPPEFEAGLKMLMATRFIPIDLSKVPVAESVAANPDKMPRFLSGPLHFPDSALARRHQGVVDLGFRIDELGRAQDIQQIFGEYSELIDMSVSSLKGGRFKVPSDWNTTKSPERTFTIEFQYLTADSGSHAGCLAADPRIKGAEVVLICHRGGPF